MRCHHANPAAPDTMPAAERDLRRQVRGQRRFLNHLAIFLLVGGGFAVFHLLFRPERAFGFWPLGGWAIALAVHGFVTLMRGRWLGAEWEERQIRARLVK